jgi:hypothetical protein
MGESSVPKAVLKSGGECDLIQKSLWSSAPQVCSESDTLKTCKKRSTF